MFFSGMRIILILFFYSLVTHSQYAPMKRYVTKHLYQDVDLPCEDIFGTNSTRVWYREGVEISQVEDWQNNVRLKSDGTLSIKNLTEDHTGKYTCQLSNGRGKTAEAWYFLEVEYPARVQISPKTQFLVKGLPGVMKCFVKSSPPLEFTTWTKNGRHIEIREPTGMRILQNGSLSFAVVTKEDQGTYRCTPYNRHGTAGASEKMHLSVIHQPVLKGSESPVTILLPPLNTVTVEGAQTVLTCQVNSSESHITHNWFREGANIDLVPWLKERTTIRKDGALVINHTSAEDSGQYLCQVMDEGTGRHSNASAYLDVQYTKEIHSRKKRTYSLNERYRLNKTVVNIGKRSVGSNAKLYLIWTAFLLVGIIGMAVGVKICEMNKC